MTSTVTMQLSGLRVRRLLAALTSLLLLACDGSRIVTVCTLIGCESGLIIQVQGNIPEPLTVSVRPVGSAPWTVRCANAACARSLLFPAFTPEYVTVTVQGEGVNVSQDVRPVYELFQPNGPKCPPQCRVARVPIQVG